MSVEAMKQALEALECLFGIPERFTGKGGGDVAVWTLGGSYRAQQAIPVLRQAIEQAEKQEPVADVTENGIHRTLAGINLPIGTKLYTTPQPNVTANDTKQESVAKPQEKRHEWAWMPAPIKTQWGHDMVVADLAIDKDHTVSVYCERDQTARVEAMFKGKTT